MDADLSITGAMRIAQQQGIFGGREMGEESTASEISPTGSRALSRCGFLALSTVARLSSLESGGHRSVRKSLQWNRRCDGLQVGRNLRAGLGGLALVLYYFPFVIPFVNASFCLRPRVVLVFPAFRG